MKKITLALFAVVCCVGSVLSQANYNLVAPPNQNATSSLRAPNGTSVHAFQRAVMYIHPYELLPMNQSSITSVSFQYTTGTGSIPVVGNFTLYLQNTTNFAYAKGSTYSGALTGMQNVYSGTYTVPSTPGPATVTIPLGTAFQFTGDGLYVGWDFASTGPFATNAATYVCSNVFNGVAEAWLGSIDAPTGGTIGNTFAGSNFRPSLIFNAVNTATNEIEVLDIIAPGRVSKLFNSPQTVLTKIVNSSIAAQNNVTVALNAVGANPYTATQTLNMAPGSITTLTWSAYNPVTDGQSTITAAALIADQNTANNSKSWVQVVSCGDIAQHSPSTTFNSSYGYGGSSGSGCFVSKHVIPSSASLTAVRVAIGAATSNTQSCYGVLVNSAGAILATSNNTTTIAPSTTVTFNFADVAVTTGTYYVGLAQPSSGYYPMAYVTNTVFIPGNYYVVPLTGGTISQSANDGYFGIEALFTFSNTAVSATASKTLVCKTNSITLTANGLTTYTWTGGLTGSVVVVTPTVSGTGGGVAVFTVTGTDAVTGCKGNVAALTVSVSACTGIASNNSNGFDVKLFPNPAANGKSTISGLSGTNRITVYNSIGQVILTQNVSEDTMSLDLSNQPSGNYLVKITDSNSESRTIKVVNQN
ncbi:T9SS type A sorting domain-containing protein [Aurantibacillus circumpalustris]|uniref:T9SS type A sorting domain-containing protein n=1 Tax=Aurantibacillus circumpalustris TaxID=3036359 RepID=UPI00295B48E4|nr:T9SS type A sorting domain-containing protein [Aurantibacillus circumpalustris]